MIETPEEFEKRLTEKIISGNDDSRTVDECINTLYSIENTFKSLAIYVLDNDTDRKFARVPAHIYDEKLKKELNEIANEIEIYPGNYKPLCYDIVKAFDSVIRAFLDSPKDIQRMRQIIFDNFPKDLAEKVWTRIQYSERPYVAVPDALAWLVHRYAEKTDIVGENEGICYAPNATKYAYIRKMTWDEAIKDIEGSANNIDEYFTKLCVFYNNLVDWMTPFIVGEDSGIQKAVYLPKEKKLYLRLGSSEDHMAEITEKGFVYYDRDSEIVADMESNWFGDCEILKHDRTGLMLKCGYSLEHSSQSTPLDALILLTQSISMDYRIYYARRIFDLGVDIGIPAYPFYEDDLKDSLKSLEEYTKMYYMNELYEEEDEPDKEIEKYHDAFKEYEEYSPMPIEPPERYLTWLRNGDTSKIYDLGAVLGTAMAVASPSYFEKLRRYILEHQQEIEAIKDEIMKKKAVI